MTLTLPPAWLLYVIEQEFCSQCNSKLLPVFIQIRLYQNKKIWSNTTEYFIKKSHTQTRWDFGFCACFVLLSFLSNFRPLTSLTTSIIEKPCLSVLEHKEIGCQGNAKTSHYNICFHEALLGSIMHFCGQLWIY